MSTTDAHIRVENGSDNPDNLEHFLGDQVGLICTLNYLDVTQYHMFFRKKCWHLVAKWVNSGFDECTDISLVWNQLIISQAVLKHVVSKDFIFKKSVQGTCSVPCQEWRNLLLWFSLEQQMFSHKFQSALVLVDVVLIQTRKFFCKYILTRWPNHESFFPRKFCTIR